MLDGEKTHQHFITVVESRVVFWILE